MDIRTKHRWHLVGIGALLHFLVDGLCLCCLYLIAFPFCFPRLTGIFVVYNILAFLTQPLTGLLADRMRDRHWMLLAAVVLLVLAAVGFFFAAPITNLVTGASETASEIAVFAFRAQLMTLPLSAWIVLCNMMLQNIGATGKATLLAVSRQGLAFIPMVLLLPALMAAVGTVPLLGIELAQPAADGISFVIAIPVGLSELRKMREEKTQS